MQEWRSPSWLDGQLSRRGGTPSRGRGCPPLCCRSRAPDQRPGPRPRPATPAMTHRLRPPHRRARLASRGPSISGRRYPRDRRRKWSDEETTTDEGDRPRGLLHGSPLPGYRATDLSLAPSRRRLERWQHGNDGIGHSNPPYGPYHFRKANVPTAAHPVWSHSGVVHPACGPDLPADADPR